MEFDWIGDPAKDAYSAICALGMVKGELSYMERHPDHFETWLDACGAWTRTHDTGDLWNRRDLFRRIYRHAGAKRVSPWSLLGHGILRALHSVPHDTYFWSYMGTPTALNVGAVFCGASGKGKSVVRAVADQFYQFAAIPVWPPAIEARSGEGIPDRYAAPGKTDPDVLEWRRHAVQWLSDEVGKLEKTGGRDGQTIFEYVKSGITGENIGGVLANGKGTELPPGSYRFTMAINAQPVRCAFMFTGDEIAGGFPQRFLWFDAEARAAQVDRDVNEHHVVPAIDWSPTYRIRSTSEIDDFLASEYDEDADELDSHARLTRVKVAIALMVLDGRRTLASADWEDAGLIMVHSSETREWVTTQLGEASAQRAKEEGRLQGLRKLGANQVWNGSESAQRTIVSWYHAQPDITRTALRNKLNSRTQKPYMDDALLGLSTVPDRKLAQWAENLLNSSHNKSNRNERN